MFDFASNALQGLKCHQVTNYHRNYIFMHKVYLTLPHFYPLNRLGIPLKKTFQFMFYIKCFSKTF